MFQIINRMHHLLYLLSLLDNDVYEKLVNEVYNYRKKRTMKELREEWFKRRPEFRMARTNQKSYHPGRFYLWGSWHIGWRPSDEWRYVCKDRNCKVLRNPCTIENIFPSNYYILELKLYRGRDVVRGYISGHGHYLIPYWGSSIHSTMLSNIYKVCKKYKIDYSEKKVNELPLFLMKKEEELIQLKI
tara:strand:- start:402 stop:962 length:561 start_codon:yes stop_codon:yes gene_type:complete